MVNQLSRTFKYSYFYIANLDLVSEFNGLIGSGEVTVSQEKLIWLVPGDYTSGLLPSAPLGPASLFQPAPGGLVAEYAVVKGKDRL